MSFENPYQNINDQKMEEEKREESKNPETKQATSPDTESSQRMPENLNESIESLKENQGKVENQEKNLKLEEIKHEVENIGNRTDKPIKEMPIKKIETKNPFLEGPELISHEQELQERDRMKDQIFAFGGDTRRYHISKDGLMVEYYDKLPDMLTSDGQTKFKKEHRIINNEEKRIFVLKYGESIETEEKEDIYPDPDKRKLDKVADFRDFTEKQYLESTSASGEYQKILIEALKNCADINEGEATSIAEIIVKARRKDNNEVVKSFASRFSSEVKENISNFITEQIQQRPEQIDCPRTAELFKNKRILFYTGAGISEASDVHAMEGLKKDLGLDLGKESDEFLEKAISNPQKLIDRYNLFVKKAVENPSTEAHIALANIAQKLKSQIFTENFDLLQEKTGVKAIKISGPWLKENIKPEWVKDIDTVITVGLSYDDRGFLGWYKENNPNGKIVAVNLTQPSYLGNEDFILRGDCQKIVPELEKEFTARE